ncbi:hypothetical protein NQ317_015791 [Molorchus minor]|uniref:Uncharacterized protein n=1 Tax=Molorchus minor TaxID=1323400 RepID=A0ABQ9J433_9CUCU|nr:hypothetical protein NQ317_015791 [Molorchus minor]
MLVAIPFLSEFSSANLAGIRAFVRMDSPVIVQGVCSEEPLRAKLFGKEDSRIRKAVTRLWPGSNYLEDLLGDVPLATVRPFEGCGCNMMVLHLTMPFRGVRIIFIVSPFHRKIAGREQKCYSSPLNLPPGPGLVGLGVNPALKFVPKRLSVIITRDRLTDPTTIKKLHS